MTSEIAHSDREWFAAEDEFGVDAWRLLAAVTEQCECLLDAVGCWWPDWLNLLDGGSQAGKVSAK